MDHVDIDVSEGEDGSGHILIFTDAGELIEMHVPAKRESVIQALRARPPSVIMISGGSDDAPLAKSLEELGHEVTLAASIG